MSLSAASKLQVRLDRLASSDLCLVDSASHWALLRVKGSVPIGHLVGFVGSSLINAGFEPAKYPSYFDNRWPHRIARNSLRNHRSVPSTTSLGLHTDLPHCRFESDTTDIAPRYIALLCIKNECSTPTILSDLEPILADLDSDLAEPGKDSVFLCQRPSLWVSENPSPIWLPLLEKTKKEVSIRYSPNLVISMSTNAEHLKQQIAAAAKLVQKQFILEERQLLIFDNQKTLHGRGEVRGERLLYRYYSW